MATTSATRALVLCIVYLCFTNSIYAFTIPHDSTLKRQQGAGGAVACESKRCSDVGVGILEKGGNAADAGFYLYALISDDSDRLLRWNGCGIGGGGFALVMNNGGFEFLNFREKAPMNIPETRKKPENKDSIGVPGELRGLQHIYDTYASKKILKWKDLVEPAIKISGNVEVTYEIAQAMGKVNSSMFYEDPWKQEFLRLDRSLVREGDVMNRTRYAKTLRLIQENGPEYFYDTTGDIAKPLLETLGKLGNKMNAADFTSYSIQKSTEVPQITYQEGDKKYTITSTWAPSSGAVGLSILKLIERFTGTFGRNFDLKSTHWLNEALRYGYGRRSFLGDDEDGKLKAYQRNIFSDETAKNTDINPDTTNHTITHYMSPQPEPRHGSRNNADDHGTSHIVVVDGNGMAITLTTTVNYYFGSSIMDETTGIILNDQLHDFYFPESDTDGYFPNNRMLGGKRPLSSISPTIVTRDNKPYFVTGAAGGIQIMGAVAQNIVNVLERNMTATEALNAPRLHDNLFDDTTLMEKGVAGFRKELKKDMHEKKNHNVNWMDAGSSAQAIMVGGSAGKYEAVGEPRQPNSGGSVVQAKK